MVELGGVVGFDGLGQVVYCEVWVIELGVGEQDDDGKYELGEFFYVVVVFRRMIVVCCSMCQLM